MNILFLTIGLFDSISQHSIYTDLLRQFANKSHQAYVVCPRERRQQLPTELIDDGGVKILKVRIGNITKTNIVEKGISTILIEKQYIAAIKKYLKGVRFDLVLYTTPPITFAKVVGYIRYRDKAKTYLMLKDIFPQNAVDIGIMSKTGIKGILFKYFRNKEKKLYYLSDRIGCMSQANVDYIIKHNPEVLRENVEICPNCIDIQDIELSMSERIAMRRKYDIPIDLKVFVYGGNLGRPQGIPFIIECLKTQVQNEKVYFLIIGDGTEFEKIEVYFNKVKPQNMKLMKRLPKDDFDRMIAACDIGMIFLDHRFTIPNFPSRLLSYMQAGLAVLACTDHNTDIGKIIVEGGFGWWCESNDINEFAITINDCLKANLLEMRKNSWKYLNENYTAERAFDIIMSLPQIRTLNEQI